MIISKPGSVIFCEMFSKIEEIFEQLKKNDKRPIEYVPFKDWYLYPNKEGKWWFHRWKDEYVLVDVWFDHMDGIWKFGYKDNNYVWNLKNSNDGLWFPNENLVEYIK